MELTLNKGRLFEGEHLGDALHISADLPAGFSVRIAFLTPKGRRVETEDLTLIDGEGDYEVPQSLLDGAGVLLSQIVAVSDERVLKSEVFPFDVEKSLPDGGAAAPDGEFYTLKGAVERIAALENALGELVGEAQMRSYVDAAVEDKAVYIVTGDLDFQTLEITNLSDSFVNALTKERVMLRLTYYSANRTRRTVDCPLIARMSGMSVNNSLTFAAVLKDIPGYAADAPTLLRIGWGGAGETISANLIPLTTASVLSALLAGKQDKLTFDGTPTAGSTNPVTSAGIKRYVDNCEQGLSDEIHDLSVDKQDRLTFDDTPTAGSDNPVKSGGIKSFVEGKGYTTKLYVDSAIQRDSESMLDYIDSYKQNKLTFDSRPTANSTNPVTSAGIRSYVQDAVGAIWNENPVFGNGVSSIQKAYAEEPASPQEGDVWYDTTGTDPLIRFYDGTDWDEGDTPDPAALYVLM